MGNTLLINSFNFVNHIGSSGEYYYERPYAFDRAGSPFPFTEEDYSLFADPFNQYVDRRLCENGVSLEISILHVNFLYISTYSIIGRCHMDAEFYTDTNKYNIDTSLSEIETPICVTDNMPINIYFDKINFNNTLYSDWNYSKGKKCLVLPGFPGYDFTKLYNMFNDVTKELLNGKAIEGNNLVLSKNKFYDDKNLLDYCISLNEYSDYRCNTVMFNYCSNNYSLNKCVAWMDDVTKQSNSIGLELYSNYCKSNLDKVECSYFSQASLNYDSKYRDDVIKFYCSRNIHDSNCGCTNTIIEHNNLITEYLGPKSCWLSSCTSNNLDNKYILTEDLKNRYSCKTNNCSINIANLELTKNSKVNIELINRCINQTNYNQIIGTNQNDRYLYSEHFYDIILFNLIPFLLFSIIIIFIYYYLKKQMYKDPNILNKNNTKSFNFSDIKNYYKKY